MGKMQMSSKRVMRLLSFSLFSQLALAFVGIEGSDVRCGDNNVASDCTFCYYTFPPAMAAISMENCVNSQDCKLKEDFSGCIRKSDNTSASASPIPVDTHDNSTDPPSDNTTIEEDMSPSIPQQFAPFLSRIEISLRNPTNMPIRKIGFHVQVCNYRNCCNSKTMKSRGGIITFASVFDNLGNCGHLQKDQAISVQVLKTTRERSPLDLMRLAVVFDDGSVFKKQKIVSCWMWENCGRYGQRAVPLRWGSEYSNLRQNRHQGARRELAVPDVQCPEVTNPTLNACPRINVRVHRQKEQMEMKSCYYQRCRTFTEDLTTIAVGRDGLGTGGYCAPTQEPEDQYIYCCDLESYFTFPNADANGDYISKNPEDIKFPRCDVMKDDHTVP